MHHAHTWHAPTHARARTLAGEEEFSVQTPDQGPGRASALVYARNDRTGSFPSDLACNETREPWRELSRSAVEVLVQAAFRLWRPSLFRSLRRAHARATEHGAHGRYIPALYTWAFAGPYSESECPAMAGIYPALYTREFAGPHSQSRCSVEEPRMAVRHLIHALGRDGKRPFKSEIGEHTSEPSHL